MLGKSTAGREADKLLIEQINECYVAPPRQRMAARHDDDEPVNAEGEGLHSLDASRVGGHQHADVGVALRYGRSYLVTEAFLQCDIDAGIGCKPAGQDIRKVFFQRRRIRHQSDVSAHPATRMFAEIAVQPLHLCQNELGMVTERSTGRGRSHASAMSLQQACSKRLLHPFHACACRGERNGCARGASGNTALLDHGSEQAQVGQIEMYRTPPWVAILPML